MLQLWQMIPNKILWDSLKSSFFWRPRYIIRNINTFKCLHLQIRLLPSFLDRSPAKPHVLRFLFVPLEQCFSIFLPRKETFVKNRVVHYLVNIGYTFIRINNHTLFWISKFAPICNSVEVLLPNSINVFAASRCSDSMSRSGDGNLGCTALKPKLFRRLAFGKPQMFRNEHLLQPI